MPSRPGHAPVCDRLGLDRSLTDLEKVFREARAAATDAAGSEPGDREIARQINVLLLADLLIPVCGEDGIQPEVAKAMLTEAARVRGRSQPSSLLDVVGRFVAAVQEEQGNALSQENSALFRWYAGLDAYVEHRRKHRR